VFDGADVRFRVAKRDLIRSSDTRGQTAQIQAL
jgi:hypothetical protein